MTIQRNFYKRKQNGVNSTDRREKSFPDLKKLTICLLRLDHDRGERDIIMTLDTGSRTTIWPKQPTGEIEKVLSQFYFLVSVLFIFQWEYFLYVKYIFKAIVFYFCLLDHFLYIWFFFFVLKCFPK